MLYSIATRDGSPVYATREKIPGYSVNPSVYSAGYLASGRLLRRRLGGWTKDDHLREARDLMAERKRLLREYDAHVDRELGFLRNAGVEPGPLISGIISEKFPERVKDALRTQAIHLGQMGGAAAAHFAAAGLRHNTFLREYHQK